MHWGWWWELLPMTLVTLDEVPLVGHRGTVTIDHGSVHSLALLLSSFFKWPPLRADVNVAVDTSLLTGIGHCGLDGSDVICLVVIGGGVE
jgi:hypothetical protein